MVAVQHYEPRVHVVGNILAGLRQGMNALEFTLLTKIGAQPLFQFLFNGVRIPFVLICSILRRFCDSRLSVIPISTAILVEKSRGCEQASQRVSENGGRFAGHRASELHPAVIDSFVVRAPWRWRS